MRIPFITQKWYPPKDPDVSFERKTIIITGANTGLGFEAAVKFVAKGASKVILGVRDTAKGDAAAKQIEQKTGRKGVTEVWQIDMGDYGSVKSFANRVKGLQRVDAVVLNAGVYQPSYELSKYGWEQTLQINALSTVLLALLLLPTLKALGAKLADGEKPVLEFVGSGRYQVATFTADQDASKNLLQTFNQKLDFNGARQYKMSKLIVHHATRELATLAADDVIVTVTCPGACKSDLSRGYASYPGFGILLAVMGMAALRTTEEGARTLVSATVQGNKVQGKWWKDDAVQQDGEILASEDGRKRLRRVWQEMIDELSKESPEVVDIARK